MKKYFLAANEYIVTEDGSWIPPDHANTDYQAYLAWIAEGNTAEKLKDSGE